MKNYQSDSERAAREFLRSTSTKMHVQYTGQRKHFPEDTESRDCYQITLINQRHVYSFQFGDSINNTQENSHRFARQSPTAYDVLACITKDQPPDNVDNFAAEYGYDKPSIAIRTYKAVCDEWENISKLFTTEEIERLQEIQ